MNENKYTTISILKDTTYSDFTSEHLHFQQKQNKRVSYDDFIQYLLTLYKKDKEVTP